MDQDTRMTHPGLAPVDDTLLTRESWKLFQIMAEFVEGFERLARIKPSVSIFGSARVLPDSPYYKLAEDIARSLSDSGFAVVSGGGPGIMEAVNKGAFAANRPASVSIFSCRTSRAPTVFRTSHCGFVIFSLAR